MDAKVLKTLHSSEDIELYKKDLQDIEFIKYIEKKFIEIEPKNDYENEVDILNKNSKSPFSKFFKEKILDEKNLDDPILKSINDKIKEFFSPSKEEETNKSFLGIGKKFEDLAKTGMVGSPAMLMVKGISIFKDIMKKNDEDGTKDFLAKTIEMMKDPNSELGKLTKQICEFASLDYQKMIKLGETEKNKTLETFFKDPKTGIDPKINLNLNKLEDNLEDNKDKKPKLKEKDIDMPMRNKI